MSSCVGFLINIFENCLSSKTNLLTLPADSKLSIKGIQDLLGLDADAGRYLVTTCQRHLAEPAHAVAPSGSSDPAALRVLKVTLIHSSLALLVDGNVGSRWFGPDAPLEPRSPHVWPDDATTLTLLFIQLLYRLTRNKAARERHHKRNVAAATSTAKRTKKAPTAESASAASPASPLAVSKECSPAAAVEMPTPPPQPELPTPATSPRSPETEPKETQSRKRKRKSKATTPAAVTPQLAFPSSSSMPSRPFFTYSSPRVRFCLSLCFFFSFSAPFVISLHHTNQTIVCQVVRDNLLSSCTYSGITDTGHETGAGTGVVDVNKRTSASPFPAAAAAAATATADCAHHVQPPPADAVFRYRINLVDRMSQERTIPQIVLAHEGPIRDAGYSHIVAMCAQLGQTVDGVSVVTISGLERVSSDKGWDHVVGRTYNQLLMDGEVRVLVSLQ